MPKAPDLNLTFGRDDDAGVLTDDLSDRTTTEPLCAHIPAENGAFQCPTDDCVSRGSARFFANNILRVFVLPDSEKYRLAKLFVTGPF